MNLYEAWNLHFIYYVYEYIINSTDNRGWKYAPSGTRNAFYAKLGQESFYRISPQIFILINNEKIVSLWSRPTIDEQNF